ncbi:GntR family transcriptional regulator [Glutamicibacter sp. JL.03c]|uniref:GntR family transcriptional regulator n=1 Tax=Glutamicibacter sp. JL.03c TaxID=2984842 RepID=UPI0021F6F3EE|nr:GntR family transcriptional regulator [Glutamicibacter sp. JL.03c]UYQ79046.1 GntR family transcriptional regulator [Glutamicibacter sp. JL.03c]
MRHAPQPKVEAYLDPASKQSKYRQIREILKTHAREACKPGYKLPPERELAEHFGVARKTIRQAIDALVDEQVLKRVVGIGTFVVPEKLDLRVRLHSYSEDMMRRGMVPDAHVLEFAEIKANANLALQLMVEEGTQVVQFKRLLLADGTPMSLDENYMPADLVPGFVDAEPPSKLYQALHERYGILLEWGEDQVESTAASKSQAHLLGVEPGFPLLQITRYAYIGERLADYSVSLYRSDRYKLFVPLQRVGTRTPRYTEAF